MAELELVFRVAAFTQLSLLCVLLLRQRLEHPAYRFAALLALGVAAYALAPLVMSRWHWGWAAYPVILAAIIVPALFWYFTNALLVDGFRPNAWIHALLLLTAVVGFAAFCDKSCGFSTSPVLDPLAQAIKLVWVVAALYTVVKDWRADLVESRRRFRLLVVVAVGGYIAVVLLVELVFAAAVAPPAELLHVSLLLLVVTALCLHMLRIDAANAFAAMLKPAEPATPPASILATQLLALMEKERAFALDPLTTQVLADKLRTQPYQLRRVINGELGYRNFNAFINQYRIEEVAHRLGLPEYHATPLLTLALDAGFRSLAPFNKSFRDHFGVTPSAYRKQLSETKKPQ